MTQADRGAGVRFPPPFLFVGGLIAAWALDRFVPLAISRDGASSIQAAAGTLLLGAGLACMFSGVGTFAKRRTTLIPNKPARTLVVTGPYRFSRNPMYVGLTGAYVGLTVILNWLWPIVLLPLVLLALTTWVIRKEEAYLHAAFGADYDAYCRTVRRWL